MSNDLTFVNGQERTESDRKLHLKYGYSIRYDREYITYMDGNIECVIQYTQFPLPGINIADFVETFENLESDTLYKVLSRIISSLIAEFKVLYIECKHEKQCKIVGGRLLNLGIIDSKSWSFSYIDANVVIRWLPQ